MEYFREIWCNNNILVEKLNIDLRIRREIIVYFYEMCKEIPKCEIFKILLNGRGESNFFLDISLKKKNLNERIKRNIFISKRNLRNDFEETLSAQ